MAWEKRGLIFCPDGRGSWNKRGFMTPHAKVMGDVIRIWGGIRDDDGISRISCIDVAADNPRKILFVSEKPSLDIGQPGCFDDNGVILGDIVEVDGTLYLYYVGFQHVQKVKFYAFSGLAISDDGGENFKRVSTVPIMDRTDTGKYGRCIHTVIRSGEIFSIYYAIINDWKYIDGIPYPIYDIWRTESKDGIHIPASDVNLCVTTAPDEYRIGRPKVYRYGDGFEMYYTRDFISKDYVIGYATSKDGISWQRDDDDSKGILRKSKSGWDSDMACYPVKVHYKEREYLFYNGNGMGLTGVGYAEWV